MMNYVSAVTNPAPKPRSTVKIVDTQTQQQEQQQKNDVPEIQEILETPPTSKGVTPSVSFDLRIPSTQQKKEGSDDNKEESKLASISVDGLDQRQPKINDIATYLLTHSDNRDFEISGGFVIYRVESGKDDETKKFRLPEFEFGTIPLALGFLNAISELLTRPQTKSISIGYDDQLILARSGSQILMRRIRGDDTSETWFQYEDLALSLRKFGKKYLKVAQAVEHTLEKKEERTDKANKDKMKKKRIAVSEKLQTRNFRSTLKTMKEHFLKTDLPALKKKYQKQEQIKDQSKKRLSEQNKDMMAMALDAAPEGFMEMDVSHIGNPEEPEPVVEEKVEEVKETEKIDKPVKKEKKKRKTKAEIRREQERNFDNIDLFTTSNVSTQQVQESKADDEEVKPRYQNAFDIGGISEEKILELTQQHQQPEKKPKTKKKKSTKKSDKKKATKASQPKSTTDVKKTQASKKKRQKNQSKGHQQQQQQQQLAKEGDDQQKYFVPVLVGLTMIAAIYYFYTLYQ